MDTFERHINAISRLLITRLEMVVLSSWTARGPFRVTVVVTVNS